MILTDKDNIILENIGSVQLCKGNLAYVNIVVKHPSYVVRETTMGAIDFSIPIHNLCNSFSWLFVSYLYEQSIVRFTTYQSCSNLMNVCNSQKKYKNNGQQRWEILSNGYIGIMN